jgi:dephospho-CoA kinase
LPGEKSRDREEPVLKVGLTGGIASGKSTVARVFAELGAHVIDADCVARDLVTSGSPALQQIARAFGCEVLRPDGTLDRATLGALVFANDEERRKLERILHPPILAEIDRRIAALERNDPRDMVVVDAALIFELGLQARYDAVVVVWAEPEQQERRLVGRDGLPDREAQRRLAAQMPLAQKRLRADFVVDNSRDEAHCRADAARVYRELLRLAGEVRLRPGRGTGQPGAASHEP